MTYMYRYKLRKGDDLNYLLEDDFSAPVPLSEASLKRASLSELNRKIGNASYSEQNYSLEVYEHIVNQPRWQGTPKIIILLYAADSKFHEKPELITT